MKLLILVFLPLVFNNSLVYAQKKSYSKKPSTNGKQIPEFQLGLITGINFTSIAATNRFSLIESDINNDKKTYTSNGPGLQLGFCAQFALNRSMAFTVAPRYSTIKFGYENHLSWTDPEVPQNNTSLDFEHLQSLQYLEFPFSVKYHFLSGRLKPFVEGGVYYGLLQAANKKIVNSRQDNSTGESGIEIVDEQTIGVKHLFIKSNTGLSGGVGVRYDVGNVSSVLEGNNKLGILTLFLSGNYKYGMNNVANVKQRYTDSRSALGTYDVLDDMKLRNIEITFGCLFSLKYKNSR